MIKIRDKKHKRQLPVIAALLPSLVLNEIAVVQALDRRQGAVFYMDIKYGQAKGAINQGDVMMSSVTGHNAALSGRRYATTLVEAEPIGAAGSKNYAGTLAYIPMKGGTLVITNGVETLTDNGDGTLSSDHSGSGPNTINYTTGVYSIKLGVTSANPVTCSYTYFYEKNASGVPTVDINMTSSVISALDFPLRANYTVGAAIDLQKAHGLKFGSCKSCLKRWTPSLN